MTLTIAEVLEYLIQKGPGRTEIDLAEAIFADKAYQQRVNQDLALLLNRGKVRREGTGGPSDPYRYHLTPMMGGCNGAKGDVSGHIPPLLSGT